MGKKKKLRNPKADEVEFMFHIEWSALSTAAFYFP